jgi:hypothetical protein
MASGSSTTTRDLLQVRSSADYDSEEDDIHSDCINGAQSEEMSRGLTSTAGEEEEVAPVHHDDTYGDNDDEYVDYDYDDYDYSERYEYEYKQDDSEERVNRLRFHEQEEDEESIRRRNRENQARRASDMILLESFSQMQVFEWPTTTSTLRNPVAERHIEARVANAMTRRVVVVSTTMMMTASSAAAAASSSSNNNNTMVVAAAAAEAKDGEEPCIICFDKIPDCRFVDCSHTTTGFICRICADRVIKESGKCPLCRKAVTRYAVVERGEEEVPDSWDD